MLPLEAALPSQSAGSAPNLLQLQRAMARELGAEGERGGEARQLGLSHEGLARLAIHRNNCRSVLINALRLVHPAVERLVGPEFFEFAARRFIDVRLPSSAWLDEYGAEFAGFLADFAPAVALPYLPDVARVDWAVNVARHAADAPALDLQRLAQLPDEEQARSELRFVPHPSLGLLSLAYAADDIWRAVVSADEVAIRAIDPSCWPVWLLVGRDTDNEVQLQRLSEPGWEFTRRLCAGEPLQAAMGAWPSEQAGGDTSEGARPEAEAQALLAEHLCAGRFIDLARPNRVEAPATPGSTAATAERR